LIDGLHISMKNRRQYEEVLSSDVILPVNYNFG